MHEYPITQQIVKIACEFAEKEKAKSVKRVHLKVGDYSGFIGESIQMYFDILGEGTLCQGGEITFDRVIPQLLCNECGKYFPRTSAYSFECPYCGGQGGPSEIGKEFYVEFIEVVK